MDKNILLHPDFTHASDIEEICRPLEKLGIDYFSHVILENGNSFCGLGKNPAFAENYLRRKYYNFDSHLSKIDNHIEYIVQDSVEHFGETEKLFLDCKSYGLNHIFTILHRVNDKTNAYHFATNRRNEKMNEIYLKNFALLQNFISYFKEKMNSNKKLMQAYDIKFQIEKEISGYQSDGAINLSSDISTCINSIKPKRHYLLDSKNTYITEREFECLFWLHNGKTAEEIATILKITERTVRAHINSLKDKLECRTLFQLGEKISQLNLTNLIHLFNQNK